MVKYTHKVLTPPCGVLESIGKLWYQHRINKIDEEGAGKWNNDKCQLCKAVKMALVELAIDVVGPP